MVEWAEEAAFPYWVDWESLSSERICFATTLEYPPRCYEITRRPRFAPGRAWVECRDDHGKVFMLELVQVCEDPDTFDQGPGRGIHTRRTEE